MHFHSLALFAASVATISASPLSSLGQLEKRDWINNNTGNIKIIFSDDTVKLGTAPIDVIVGNLSALCSVDGQCETGSTDITGYQLVDAGYGSDIEDETISISPSGSYPEWIHNGLLEALGAAVQAVANCSDVTNQPSCSGSEFACAQPSFTVNECTVPRYWGINFQAPDATDSAPPFIGADLTVSYDNGAGFCSTFTTVGSAVAGAVNGAAGGIFSLLSLACQS